MNNFVITESVQESQPPTAMTTIYVTDVGRLKELQQQINGKGYRRTSDGRKLSRADVMTFLLNYYFEPSDSDG